MQRVKLLLLYSFFVSPFYTYTSFHSFSFSHSLVSRSAQLFGACIRNKTHHSYYIIQSNSVRNWSNTRQFSYQFETTTEKCLLHFSPFRLYPDITIALSYTVECDRTAFECMWMDAFQWGKYCTTVMRIEHTVFFFFFLLSFCSFSSFACFVRCYFSQLRILYVCNVPALLWLEYYPYKNTYKQNSLSQSSFGRQHVKVNFVVVEEKNILCLYSFCSVWCVVWFRCVLVVDSRKKGISSWGIIIG